MGSEFQENLRELLVNLNRPVTEEERLVLRGKIRESLWVKALMLDHFIRGRCIPTPEERVAVQLELRIPLLGKKPQKEWVSDLKWLVQTEVDLDAKYRALQWQVYQDYFSGEINYPPEGYEFVGPGLLWERLEDVEEFIADRGLTRCDVQEEREDMMGLGSDVTCDLEFLTAKEWELIQKYRRLFETVQQHHHREQLKVDLAPVPELLALERDAVYSCLSSDSELEEESADGSGLEHPGGEPATEPFTVFFCPTPTAVPDCHDLIDFMPEVPTITPLDDDLATRQNGIDVAREVILESVNVVDCPEEVLMVEPLTDLLAEGQSVSGVCHYISAAPVEGLIITGNIPDCHLAGETTVPVLQGVSENCTVPCLRTEETAGLMAFTKDVHSLEHSANVPDKSLSLVPPGVCLETVAVQEQGQSFVGLCPPNPAVIEGLNSPQKVPEEMADVSAVRRTATGLCVDLMAKQAEELATGQNVADFCPAPMTFLEALRRPWKLHVEMADEVCAYTSTAQAEELATGQNVADLCPAPMPTLAFPSSESGELPPHRSIDFGLMPAWEGGGLLTTAGPDLLEVCDPGSLCVRGEKCHVSRDRMDCGTFGGPQSLQDASDDLANPGI